MKRSLACVLVLAGLSACRDGAPTDPLRLFTGDPRSSISDGANADGANPSNPHFYFLPEIAKGAPSFGGSFAPHLSPKVKICRVTSTAATTPAAAACHETLVEFSGAQITVSTIDEHYRVNWDTDLNPGSPSTYYRVIVTVSGLELGYADVYVATSAKDLKNVETNTLGLIDGRMLPIKFRIEHGAVAAARAILNGTTFTCNDCVEATAKSGVTTDVVTPGRFAATRIPAGAIHPNVGEVTVTISRKNVATEGPCLPTAQPQAEACYRYDTEPFLPEGFGFDLDPNTTSPGEGRVDVFVEQCFDSRKTREDYVAAKFSSQRAREGIVYLDPAAELNLADNCANFQPSDVQLALERSPMRRLAFAGMRALGQLFSPESLHAEDSGLTSSTGAYSEIGWLEPLELSISAGDAQSALAGATLPLAPTVRVLNHHTLQPIPGAVITFAPAAGTVGTPTATTDTAGQASTSWTLGSAAGTQLLTATVTGLGSQTLDPTQYDHSLRVTFTATANAPVQVSLSPTTDSIYVGETATFTATVTNTDNTAVTWSTGNTSVATVSASGNTGTVTGVAAGTTTVTAVSVADPSKSASATLVVLPAGEILAQLSSESGASLQGSVTIVELDRTALTDAKGTARFTSVPYGTYTLLASAPNWQFSPRSLMLESSSVTEHIAGTAVPPVSRWAFDGDLTDATGPNDDGTIVGRADYVTGILGQGLQFLGNAAPGHAVASGTNFNDATTFSISAWVSLAPDTAAVQRFVTLQVEKAVLRLDGRFGGVTNSPLHFYGFNPDGIGAGLYRDGALTDRSGCFYHVVGTHDGTTLRMYLNNVLVGSTPLSGSLRGSGVRFSNDGGETLNGTLDEVRVYAYALSQEAIRDHYLAVREVASATVCPSP